MRTALIALTAIALAMPAYAAPDVAHAHLAAFETDLDSHASATAVLQAWCDAHGPAPGTKIVARLAHEAKAPTAMAAQALNAPPSAAVRYRRVDLMCGDLVLSRADNWYLPARLTPAMNHALDQTRTPFGVAVAALDFTRRNLSTDMLLDAPDGSDGVLRHSAVLLTGAGEPFSVVVETYTRAVLAY